MRILIIKILILSITISTYCQNSCDTIPFIDCNKNHITTNKAETLTIIEKYAKIGTKENPIRIVHIGDSHLQAGFFTEKIKQELFQEFSTDTIASPGFIFPYTIAQTNNPFYYKVNYTGSWEWCKNIDTKKKCSLGLSGITVRTKDSVASIHIKMQNKKYNYPVKYYFNSIKILHSKGLLDIYVNEVKAITEDGVSIINLENLTDSISVKISIRENRNHFELYGLILDNIDENISYHTIGVNGATAQSYLKCDYFSKHLSNINPDLVFISLGTNEAFDMDFNIIEHEYILKDLVFQIKNVVPEANILLTIPNDHFKKGKSNKNVIAVRENILKICNELNLSSWDFYSIMGGESSIENWYKKGLTGEDKIHFKKKGYEVQGELFVNAFIQLIKNH